jgi:hypothetical protein
MPRKKQLPEGGRILRYNRHWCLPVPFLCIEHTPGHAVILWPPNQRGKDIQIDKREHNGREHLPPEKWDDELCVAMAKYALTGKC